jgi:copper oxidase (laccase) domain-containing protein
MEEQGAMRSQMYATLGPTIQQTHYEVGPEFPHLFPPELYNTYFYPAQKEGHHYFNLPSYILHQLLNERIAHIQDVMQDTFIGKFASRRRFLSQGIDKISFHNLSAIAIM